MRFFFNFNYINNIRKSQVIQKMYHLEVNVPTQDVEKEDSCMMD